MQAATYLRMARRWGWLIVAGTLLAGATAFLLTARMTPRYEATAILIVAHQADVTLQRGDLDTSAVLATTFTEIATITPVLERAVIVSGIEMPLGELRRSLEVQQVGRGQLVRLTAAHADPVLARDLANAVAQAAADSPETATALGGARINILERAQVPAQPAAPSRTLNAGLGALLGLIACLGLVALFEHLNNTVRRPQEIVAETGVPVLAAVTSARLGENPAEILRAAKDPRSRRAEEYRAAGINLRHALVHDDAGELEHRVVLITSPNRGVGQTTVIANLAVALGASGYRTLVIDGDLMTPSLHRAFSVAPEGGLAMLLRDSRRAIATTIYSTPYEGVSLLPAGAGVASPLALLSSARMHTILDEVSADYDIVLLDAPADLPQPDALMLAAMSDATVIVALAGKTRAPALRAMVEQLQGSTSVAGIILCELRSGRDTDQEDEQAHPEPTAVVTEVPTSPRGGRPAVSNNGRVSARRGARR